MRNHVLGLSARERPRRGAQSRRHPSGRRPVQRRRRGGRQQRQGDAGDAASLRPAAVRRRSRAAFPHAHRHRLQPERGGGGRHRHRGGLDQARGRRHRRHRQAGHRLRHRAAWRPRHDHARLEGGQGTACSGRAKSSAWSARSRSSGSRASAANRTPPPAAAPTRPSAMPSTSSTRPAARWSSARPRRSPAASISSPRAAATTQVRAEFMRMFDRYQEVINRHKTTDLSDSQPTKGNIAGRPDDDRGEGARQHPEDRQEMPGRRRARQGARRRRTPGCGSWTARRRRRRWLRCARRRASWCTSFRPGRATSSAIRFCR